MGTGGNNAPFILEDQAETPRKLTPRECLRLQGFPETFKIVVSNTQIYKQIGNAVAIPVLEAIAQEILRQ
jgi:DNA (cytosine-5)-methyltransferase 1